MEIELGVRKGRSMLLSVDRKRVKEHLGLAKLLITICCSAVGGLFLRFVGIEDNAGILVKLSGFVFVLAILFLCLSYKVLIDHEDTTNNYITGKSYFVIVCGLGLFFLGIVLLVSSIF